MARLSIRVFSSSLTSPPDVISSISLQNRCKIYYMANRYRHGRPTIGVLIGWHMYWTPNPYGYLNPIFRGMSAAVKDRDCNLLLACGMGSQVDLSEQTRPAWPTLVGDVDFVP